MEKELCYYSERGMVNAIVYSLYKYDRAFFHFLKAIRDVNGKLVEDFKKIKCSGIKKYTIYNELSLGQFGDPDLMIRVDFKDEVNKDPIFLFIEAKVGTYINSVKNHYITEGYDKNNNASRINFQLNLKKRFVDAYLSTPKDSDSIVEKREIKNDKQRKIEKNSIVKQVMKIMEGITEDNIYYISMTSDRPDRPNPYDCENKDIMPFINFKNEDELNKHLGYITYEDIEYQNENLLSKDKVILYDAASRKMFKLAKDLANNIVEDE